MSPTATMIVVAFSPALVVGLLLVLVELIERAIRGAYWAAQSAKDEARRLAAESYQPDNEGPYR